MGPGLSVYPEEAAEDRPTHRYRAFQVAPAGGPDPMLFLVCRNHDDLILDYGDLESIGNPPGVEPNDVALMRFRGSVSREVRIEGRRLLEAVRHLWRHRAYCLEETPGGWDGSADEARAVITRITITELNPCSTPPLPAGAGGGASHAD